MTLATSLLFPTNFLQACYLNLVEYERGAEIGSPLPRNVSLTDSMDEEPAPTRSTSRHRNPSLQLAVRITSIVHAGIQAVCAAIETVPLLTISTIIVLRNSTGAGFMSRDGGLLERIALVTISSLASLWVPVGTSLYTAIVPNDLNDERCAAETLPAIAKLYLLVHTLPSLPKLVDDMGGEARDHLERALGIHHPTEATCSTTIQEETSADPLQQVDRTAFEWRSKLIDRLIRKLQANAASFDALSDLSQPAFLEDLQAAVVESAIPHSTVDHTSDSL